MAWTLFCMGAAVSAPAHGGTMRQSAAYHLYSQDTSHAPDLSRPTGSTPSAGVWRAVHEEGLRAESEYPRPPEPSFVNFPDRDRYQRTFYADRNTYRNKVPRPESNRS